MRIIILDGYVDEPTCLGVPPYLSPYPRYIAGSLWVEDHTLDIHYVTIDQLRSNQIYQNKMQSADVIIVITGMMVPGRYLSGYPVSHRELVDFLQPCRSPLKILCGPAARHGFGVSGGKQVRDLSFLRTIFDLIITGDPEIVLTELIKNHWNQESIDLSMKRPDPTSIRKHAIQGARLVKQHPNFPQYLICEIETYRGCPRAVCGGCSFCIEPLKGLPQFRQPEAIIKEIQALYTAGIRHVRIGNQPCLFSYLARDTGKNEFPTPNPLALEQLFKGIWAVAPDLQTLHIDNVNPGVLAHHPEESKRIAETIIKYHTSGDVAAFGVESVDPDVIKANNLKGSAEEIKKAVQLLNSVGAQRGKTGLPELLPGLNFVFGLQGETKETFQLNYAFLQDLVDEGLLVRRINLRQVIPLPGTRMEKLGTKLVHKHKHLIHQFKRNVQQNIEQPLLKALAPRYTVLTDVYLEKHDGKTTFGRQLGSYPLLIGIPGVYPLHQFFKVKITDHGYRSLTAIPYPLDINKAPRETLEAIPGIGKKRAVRLLAKRPFHHANQIKEALDDDEVVQSLKPFLQ